jgi:TATA-box binding protein (TBP) (component of TFIID and TFIIIB)
MEDISGEEAHSQIEKSEREPQKVVTKSNEKDEKYVKSLMNFLDIENKPQDMIISTMTLTCALDTEYNLDNICKYIELNHTGIISIRYGDPHDERTNRTLIPEKAYIIQRKKNKKSFYNQATFKIKTKKSKIVNLKLFKNGSIQMTGIKNMEGALEALYKLFEEIKQVKYIIEVDKDGKKLLVKKEFAADVSKIDITKVQKYKIAMINSNYNIDFNIDREKLYHLMIEDNIECAYDPIIHASVNVKFNHPEKKISIFIFEKGSIIITGARTCMQIKQAYDFINKYLLTNYMKIIKNEGYSNSTIMKFLSN